MLLRIWEGKGGREKRGGKGPKGVHGWRWGSFNASPRVWVKALISQNMSQFSSKFSKALVTQTPKGVKSPCSLAQGMDRRIPFLKPAGPCK